MLVGDDADRLGAADVRAAIVKALDELDEHTLRQVLRMVRQLPPGVLLAAAALWPSPWLARAAELAMLLAWLLVWFTLDGVRRRANRFVLSVVRRR